MPGGLGGHTPHERPAQQVPGPRGGLLPALQTSLGPGLPLPAWPGTPVSGGRGGGGHGGGWSLGGTPHTGVLRVWGLWPELKGTEQRDPVAEAWLQNSGELGGASAVAGRGVREGGQGREGGGAARREAALHGNWWCKQSSIPLTRGETESQRSARLTCREGRALVTLGAPQGRACVTGPRVGISASCRRAPPSLSCGGSRSPWSLDSGSWGLLPGPASRGPQQRPRPAAVAGPESPSVSQSASCLVLVLVLGPGQSPGLCGLSLQVPADDEGGARVTLLHCYWMELE